MRDTTMADELRKWNDGAVVKGAAMLMAEKPTEHSASGRIQKLLKIITQVRTIGEFIWK